MEQESENVALVKVHNAKDMNVANFWTAHYISGTLVIVALLFILLARGPRRKDVFLPTDGAEKSRESNF